MVSTGAPLPPPIRLPIPLRELAILVLYYKPEDEDGTDGYRDIGYEFDEEIRVAYLLSLLYEIVAVSLFFRSKVVVDANEDDAVVAGAFKLFIYDCYFL